MKLQSKSNFAVFAVSAVFLLAVTVSCKKSNSSSGSTQLTATVSGTAWAANFPATGIYSTAGQEFEIGAVQFKGGDSTALALAFLAPITLNRAVSSDTASVDVAYIDTKSQVEYDGGGVAGHSLLTITSYDSVNHKIGGTFSGVLYNITGGSDSLIITNGSFSSTYTAQ